VARTEHARPLRSEPFYWLAFTAGGGVSAFLFPAHIVILGIAWAAGWLPDDALSYQRVHDLAQNPLVKIYLFVLIVLPMFHAAHRIRYGIRHELRVEENKHIVASACYGAAFVGTALTISFLLRI
jgi:succinate dehydrogenase subunit D